MRHATWTLVSGIGWVFGVYIAGEYFDGPADYGAAFGATIANALAYWLMPHRT